MVQSHKKNQSNKSKTGKSLEKEVYDKLQEAIEQADLENRYTVIRSLRVDRLLHPEARTKQEFDCDVAIKEVATGDLIFGIGCKTSFRERYRLDILNYVVFRKQYPGLVWYEVTKREKGFHDKKQERPWTDEDQLKYINEKKMCLCPFMEDIVILGRDGYFKMIRNIIFVLKNRPRNDKMSSTESLPIQGVLI